MRVEKKTVEYKTKTGAVCRCPACGHVCQLLSDPVQWRKAGENPLRGCRHLVGVEVPRQALTQGEAVFKFNVTGSKAA